MCKVNTVELKVTFDSKLFDNNDLKKKAEYVMALKQAEQDVKDALAQVKTIFEEDLNDSRNDITETVQITTTFGVVELPGGYAEKTLKDGDIKFFSDELEKKHKQAYESIISMVPKINKVEVNRLKKEIGPLKDLIDSTYRTEDPRPAKYTLSKTI